MNLIEELINLEIRKRELEKNEIIVLLLKLVEKYNTFYSNKCGVKEAILLENLIKKIKVTALVSEYFDCLNSINVILKQIYFVKDGIGYSYSDLSAGKFILFKNK